MNDALTAVEQQEGHTEAVLTVLSSGRVCVQNRWQVSQLLADHPVYSLRRGSCSQMCQRP
eukprot:363940-Chlamydomonas_euryale.AAC.7